jgi:rhodanese-related sulfurtransferase
MTATISTQDFARLHAEENLKLIDVRTPAEFRAAHVRNAQNVPLDALDPASLVSADGHQDDQPIYLICQKGGRGQLACERFVAAGHTNVVNVEGGTSACEAAGMPIVRGKQTMSMERQVRIVAGSLVLLGALLAMSVHVLFALLPALVGGGLVFSGLTDTCGMALLLAKMPWNQVSEP